MFSLINTSAKLSANIRKHPEISGNVLLYRLFFGYQNGSGDPLHIKSIRKVKSNMNLEEPIGAITALDSLLTADTTANSLKGMDNKKASIIKELIEYKLISGKKQIFDKYVYDTFECFINHKETISFIPYYFYEENMKDEKLLDLLIYEYKDTKRLTNVISWDDVDDRRNLMKPEIFQVFTNLKTINVSIEYPVSLLALLSMIKDTSVENVAMPVIASTLFPSSSVLKSIESEYKKEGFVMLTEEPFTGFYRLIFARIL